MKAMKFKVKDEQHSKEIQEALFEAGYGWLGIQKYAHNTEMPILHAGYFGDNSITYCTSEKVADELGPGEYNCQEHFLFNGQFVTAEYFTQPATTEKTYEPLPEAITALDVKAFTPRKEHAQQRMQELLAQATNLMMAEGCIWSEVVQEITEVNEWLLSQRHFDEEF